MEAALRFEDLHRRLKLLAGLKNRAPMLHLLHALSDTGTAAAAAAANHHGAAPPAISQMPPRVFSEPAAGLSGIGHVIGQGLPAAATASVGGGGYHGGGVSNGREPVGEGRRHAEAMGVRAGRHRSVVSRAMPRRTTEVTERTLLKGILYAFQVRRLLPGPRSWGRRVGGGIIVGAIGIEASSGGEWRSYRS